MSKSSGFPYECWVFPSEDHWKRGEVLRERKQCIAKKAMLSMQASAAHLADELGQDVLLIFNPEGEKSCLWSVSLQAPQGHLGPPSLRAWGRGHTPMEDVTSASSAPRSHPLPPAVLTPRSLLSRRADSRVPPRPPRPRGRSAEKHPHRPQASGTLRLRTLLQPELADPGPKPRFRLARAAVASGTGSPASGYGPRPPATQSRCSWAGVQRHKHLLSVSVLAVT